MADLLITWPKKRSLQSYLDELVKAEDKKLVINFRVPSLPRDVQCWNQRPGKPPKGIGDRCWIVHDGMIRGYNRILGVGERDDVIDPISGSRMAPGFYITRDPHFYDEIHPAPYKGFQGFRYAPTELLNTLMENRERLTCVNGHWHCGSAYWEQGEACPHCGNELLLKCILLDTDSAEKADEAYSKDSGAWGQVRPQHITPMVDMPWRQPGGRPQGAAYAPPNEWFGQPVGKRRR